MKIKIKFYKKSKSIFWKLIRFQQRLLWIPERYARYSHVEIWLWNKLYNIDDVVDSNYIKQYWLSFSSSEEDWGCRFKCIKMTKRKWDSCSIDVTSKEYKQIINFCKTQNWNKYWKVAIFFAQILNFNCKREWTWFCSEIVTHALQQTWILCTINSLFTKPWQLALELESKWYIIE